MNLFICWLEMNGEIAILILIHSTRIILNKFSYLWLKIIIYHSLSPFIKNANKKCIYLHRSYDDICPLA
jgi:hypothetical protein